MKIEVKELELRDLFAYKAMEIVSTETDEVMAASLWDSIKGYLKMMGLTFLSVNYVTQPNSESRLAEKAYKYADAMMAQRCVK